MILLRDSLGEALASPLVQDKLPTSVINNPKSKGKSHSQGKNTPSSSKIDLKLSPSDKMLLFNLNMLIQQDLNIDQTSYDDMKYACPKLNPCENYFSDLNTPSETKIKEEMSSDDLSCLVRVSPLDDTVLISLDALMFRRGFKRNVTVRERTKSFKSDFIFLEDTSDQSIAVKNASNMIQEIASNFPSIWIRYIPTYIKFLKHSLISYHNEETISLDPGKSVDIFMNDLQSLKQKKFKVGFRFYGDHINEPLWTTIINSLREIPSILLHHTSSAKFGVHSLYEMLQSLYDKRSVI